MSISPITKEQWTKVAKALGYAFVSTFVVALVSSNEFSKAAISAAAVAGFNAVLVAVKQLFTQS